MSWGRDSGENGLCDPLGMVSERNGRAQQVFCYRAGDKPAGLSLTAAGEVWFCLPPACCPERSSPWVRGREVLLALVSDKATSGRKEVEGMVCGIHRRCGQG